MSDTSPTGGSDAGMDRTDDTVGASVGDTAAGQLGSADRTATESGSDVTGVPSGGAGASASDDDADAPRTEGDVDDRATSADDDRTDGEGAGDGGGGSDPRSDEERDRAAEEFAREHDPADHDVQAGEEFRQPGDWTAEGGTVGEDEAGDAGGSGQTNPR